MNEADGYSPETFWPTSEQMEIIQAPPEKKLLVVAGPGTGKTQVAALRLVHLLQTGLQPAQILVLSFSRSAVATLLRRIAQPGLADTTVIEDLRHLAVRTFDAWSFRILRQHGMLAQDLLRQNYDDNIAMVTSLIADRKNADMGERLKSIRHVIIDEFQDLPGVRAALVTELLSRLCDQDLGKVGFTVLGDPAQAIFRFQARGSVDGTPVDPWQALKQRMGRELEEVRLLRNHRSTETLASMALAIRKILQAESIAPEKKLEAMQRFLKRMPASIQGTKISSEWLTQQPAGLTAILTRTNGEAIRVATMLMHASDGQPSVRVCLHFAGSSPSAPAWIAVLLSKFKPKSLARSTFDIVYDRIEIRPDHPAWSSLMIPRKDIAWQQLAHACGASDNATAVDLDTLIERLHWPDAFPHEAIPGSEGICVTTIHQAKGMEFDNVLLLEAKDRKDHALEDPLEEANIGFVAITRARKHLSRIPSDSIYKAPHEWVSHGRSRQICWGAMLNMQLGIPGDIDPAGFVDEAIHGGRDKVEELQKTLMLRSDVLRGHRVILRRSSSGTESSRIRDVRYDIHLQEGNLDGLLIGRMSGQMTQDLLELLWDRKFMLPQVLFNLRIGDIVTVTAPVDTDRAIPDPWRTSRLWLGITLWGTGDFKTRRRHGN